LSRVFEVSVVLSQIVPVVEAELLPQGDRGHTSGPSSPKLAKNPRIVR
jgi:hypothetical protein